FKSLAKDLEDVNFSSKKIKDAKDVINTYALIYNNNRDLIMTALASSGKKTNSSIATTIHGVFDRILISGIFARLHALAPFMKSAKEQALRNQILDAIKLAKTNKEVISNLKNIKIADQEQSRIFKDALDNYIKVDKEQNKILKDALIKEGVIKGDNFFMDKADPKDNSLRFIGKNGKEYTINKDVRNEWMKTFNLKNIDDEYIPNIPKEAKIALKDREIKLTKGSLLKLIEKDRIKYIPHIKETLESPQAILKDKDDFIFIKNIDNQTYFTSIGKDYETHLTIISNSPKKQNNIKNKMKNAEVVYYNNARALPTSRASSETKQVSFSNENSTQAKPKKNLMNDIKENIKAKEVKKKNKKSVKQRLDEKIQNDKKASEDILKRYDNFLKENKDYNLDFLDNMNLNTVEYNLTRQMIINAKESTNKEVKKDIPSALRGKIEQELNIQPLKEFGENYAEYYHDGKGALQKLLIEKQGQVAGAFHRKDLGDIDLVWGEVIDKIKHKGYGLAHIIDKHPELDLKLISDIVDKGKLNNQNNIRYRIEYKNYIIGLSSEYKGNKRTFIITAFERYKG
ncbi:PBECR2 nuclease fold domain-containing protein, partial [Campylobacter jejuni]